MHRIHLGIILQSRAGRLLVAQVTIQLAQVRPLALMVARPTMMRVCRRLGAVHRHTIGTILLPEIEDQKSGVTCLDRLLMIGHLGHRRPGRLLKYILAEVTILAVAVTPGTIGRMVATCLHLLVAVEVVSLIYLVHN